MFRFITIGVALSIWASAAGFGDSLPIVFEPNRGQVHQKVRWLARAPGYTLFLTEDEAVLALRGEAVSMKLAGSHAWRTIQGLEPTGGVSNYFLGDDPRRWRTGIPHYRRVKVEGVYEGVDLLFYGDPRKLEYDLLVQPGADAGQIRLAYEGVSRLVVEPGGDLVLTTNGGAVLRQPPPMVYQEIDGRRVQVAGVYQILDGRYVAFEVSFYDRRRSLVIDPAIVYSTYLGGALADMARGVAVDASGSVYLAGSTTSNNFPVQSGSQNVSHGIEDVFVSKLNPAGNALVYSTYLGGKLNEQALGIAVDGAGVAYITGYTISGDFPTQSPLQAHRGAEDVFVTKLNAAGNALVYSTYLGGVNTEFGRAIAVDASGAAHVSGATNSSDFPTQTPYQTLRGASDVFVAKLTPAGGALQYSTYLGGSGDDDAWAVAVDQAGSAYVTGRTSSNDFPTEDPFQRRRGGRDAFVTKFAADGRSLSFSTYLGGAGDEIGLGIAVDQAGCSYVAGYTESADFPTRSPFQTRRAGQDAFVTKLDEDGDELIYSTYLGGAGADQAWGIALDSAGAAYVAGFTASSDFPTRSAPQTALAAGEDAFVTKLDAAGSGPVYSTYLGGAGRDMAYSVAVDAAGAVYVVGGTASGNLPPASPIQTFQGVDDAFVAKFEPQPPLLTAPVITEVANAWSGQPLVPDSGWAYIKGTGLSQTTRTWRTGEIVGGRLPASLDGVSVRINNTDAYVYYISPTQINVQAGSDLFIGEVAVEVTNMAGKSAAFRVEKAYVSPALFVWFPGTATEGNKYVGAVTSDGQQVVYIGKPGLLSPVGLPTRPAKPGETVLLFATGCGPTTPPVPAGQVVTGPIPTLSFPVEVRIGGIPATVANDTGYLVFAGECQFNVTIPPTAPDGDLRVELEIAGVPSQSDIFITVQR